MEVYLSLIKCLALISFRNVSIMLWAGRRRLKGEVRNLLHTIPSLKALPSQQHILSPLNVLLDSCTEAVAFNIRFRFSWGKYLSDSCKYDIRLRRGKEGGWLGWVFRTTSKLRFIDYKFECLNLCWVLEKKVRNVPSSFMTVPPNYPSFSETHFCFVCTFKASIVIF